MKHGRAAFVTKIGMFISMGGLTIKPIETHAVGGETGIVVRQRRMDSITINGRKMEVPLVNLGPPPGGAPGAPGAPGGRRASSIPSSIRLAQIGRQQSTTESGR